MVKYENLTNGLQTILLMYQKGYINHVTFLTTDDKIDRLMSKWEDEFGTNLPAHKRHYRKSKGLANAVAYSMPVIGSVMKKQVILMATEDVNNMPDSTSWHRQNWTTRYPEISKFEMFKDINASGKQVMTWKILAQDLGEERVYLNHVVHSGNVQDTIKVSTKLVRLYPMFGGVRRQIRVILKDAARQWQHKHKSPWIGPDPDALPILSFREAGKKESRTASARNEPPC